MQKENKVLGLDLGVSSIGWALLNSNDNKIINSGVIKFESPINLQTGKSPGQERNAIRMARKQVFRKKLRKQFLTKFFIQEGLLPSDFGISDNFSSINPYELRYKAIHGIITPLEFARICYQIIQRRGYKNIISVYEDEQDTNKNKIESGYNDFIGLETTKSNFLESGCLTIGEYFYNLYETNSKIRSRFVPRELYVDELYFIINKQKNNIPLLNNEKFVDKLLNPKTGVLFFQRPLKSQKHKIGKCIFEKTKARIKKSHPSYEIFRVLQLINNISWLDNNDQICVPTREQSNEILNLFKSKDSIKSDEILTILGFTKKNIKDISFSGLDLKSSYPGCKTHLLMNNLFGFDRWEKFSENEKIEIWNLFNFFDKTEIKNHLINKYGLSNDEASIVDTTTLNSEYGQVSKKFIDAIMPFLKEGYNYFMSTLLAGVIRAFDNKWNTFNEVQKNDILNEVMNLHQVNDDDSIYFERVGGLLSNKYGLSEKDLSKLYNHSVVINLKHQPLMPGEKLGLPKKTIMNPAVNKALFLIRKLILEIINTYGSIDKINIEMARDFGINKKTADLIYKNQKDNENINKKIIKELEDRGISNDSQNIKKLKLFKECNGLCVYTGKAFTISQLFNGEINLEHIVPYSIIPNNSFKNLALCYADENLRKGNKTPFEFYSADSENWKQIKARAKKAFSKEKYLHFINDSIPDFQEFSNRQLNDTRYIMTEVKAYLMENVCSNIFITTGEVTSKLRKAWNLNEILGEENASEKNTQDNRNHTLDAIVIALTNFSLQRQLLECKRKKISINSANIKPPYDLKTLQRDIVNHIMQVVVKYQEKKKFKVKSKEKKTKTYVIRRKLHDANPFGLLSDGRYVKRMSLSSWSPSYKSMKDNKIKIVDIQVMKSVKKHLFDYGKNILTNIDNKYINDYKEMIQLEDLSENAYNFLCKKAFNDSKNPVYLIDKQGNRSQIIKKVRVAETSGLTVPIGTNNTKRYVSPNKNEYWIATWDDKKQKYITNTISCLELSLSKNKIYSNDNKKIVLKINDYVIASKDIDINIPLENINKELLANNIYRVQKTSEGILELISHIEASVPNPKKEDKEKKKRVLKLSSAKGILEFNLRKINLNIIGNIIENNNTLSARYVNSNYESTELEKQSIK